MRKIAAILLTLAVVLGTSYAYAAPDEYVRVIVLDYDAGGLGKDSVFSITPASDPIAIDLIDNEEVILFAERLAVFDGDLYVGDVDRVLRLNLNSEGRPDPAVGNNVEEITGSIFSSIVGIAVDSNGLIYVADGDNQIYAVDPSGAPSSDASPILIDTEFGSIRHIIINNNELYVLDLEGDDGNGAIYKINIASDPSPAPYQADRVYSDEDSEQLWSAESLAVFGDRIFVSGFEFSFGPGIIEIDATSGDAVMFSNQMESPQGLAVDPVGQDLYVGDTGDTSVVYRFSLDGTLEESINDARFGQPGDLAILRVTELPEIAFMSITKSVNATLVAPGSGLLYTIIATNNGPAIADSVIITDFLQSPEVESVMKTPVSLSYTAHVDRNGVVSQEGTCERRSASLYVIDCTGFGPLDVGEFIIITLDAKVDDSATGTLVNRAVVNNFGSPTAEAAVSSSVSVAFSSVAKTAAPNPVVAGGSDSIVYNITVENKEPNASDATSVVITDVLPVGISLVSINSQPLPVSCVVLPDEDTPASIQCGPYTILGGQSVSIEYSVDVAPSAQNPFANSMSVTCDQCPSAQSASASTDIIRESDLAITKEADKSLAVGGESISYTVEVTNYGPSDADNVVVIDSLPAGAIFVAAGTSPECSYELPSHTVTCTLPSLDVEDSHTFTINASVSPSAVDTLVNVSSVTSDSADPDTDNNQSESVEIEVDVITDVSISKSGPANAISGNTITYSISVTNTGTSDATGVQTVDDITEMPLVFIASLPTDPGCHLDAGSVFCDFGTVGPGMTETKIFQVQIVTGTEGDIENFAEVFADIDNNFDNNISNTVITSVIAVPPIQLYCGLPETAYDKVILGTNGNDVLKGGPGNNLILGYEGNNKIDGGPGNDCIIVGDGDNTIKGGPGNDSIIAGNGNNRIEGGPGDDEITTGNGNNVIVGGPGNDSITTGTGNDLVWAGPGNDIIISAGGNNRIFAGPGNDEVTTGGGDDTIHGGQGDDVIVSSGGNNRITGGQGNDTITTGDGNDWIHGGQGNDTIYTSGGNNIIFGGQGNDHMTTGGGSDTIHGGQGNDHIDAGAGSDTCFGGQGNNDIHNCDTIDSKMKEDKEDNEDKEPKI